MNNIKQPPSNGISVKTPYPNCIPATSFGITQFWAEEYWTGRQIQKIRNRYPGIDFRGLIDGIFENHLKQILKKPPHIDIVDTTSFGEIPKNSWKISYKKLTLATSHAPSRYKAQTFLKKHKDQFRILTFDAHLDLGNYAGIHGAWLTDNLAKRTAIIGGWAEPHYELKSGYAIVPHIRPDFKQLCEEKSFLDWISKKKIYISIDLDYLQSKGNYLGLSCYWHRNLFIGHTLNINQQIQMLPDHIDLFTPTLIGKELNIFEDLSSFMESKIKSINSHIQMLMKLFTDISTLLQDNESSLLGMDLVEYSAISDWRQLSVSALLNNFDLFEKLVKPVYEK